MSYQTVPLPSYPKPQQSNSQKYPITISFNPKQLRKPNILGTSKTISPYWEHISTLRDEFKYSEIYKANIKKLTKTYCGWKRVRGDGNCYYRSVISTYFQKIFHFNQPESRVYDFIESLSQVSIAEREYNQEIQELIDFVNILYMKKLNSRPKEKVDIFFYVLDILQDENFDLKLIKVARILSYQLLISENGSYLKSFILPEEWDHLLYGIMDMGREAEGLELSLLPKALNIEVVQINIFQEQILVSKYPGENSDDEKIKIFIISKSRGHYDALYSNNDMEVEDFSLKHGGYMVDI